MMRVIGGMYLWAVREFLKRNEEILPDTARISIYENMIIPVTPMAFSQRQPEDSLLDDDCHMIAAYGLEPDIIPRMRELRSAQGLANEVDILPLLGRDRMDDHLLKRSWAGFQSGIWRKKAAREGGCSSRWMPDALINCWPHVVR